ncbi:type II toxin-antitoxin system RelE/ParE family toxin [Epilithonimonas tenax]|uniref:type II toxin-antitoxin system RelE/ParE family toxin n=1 Tax=Epilithonimonas tenax TaxID=191577 RepID=UPI00040B502C|nr:type II toxin-antitoxin system RelE/ParE family toxin [Epilithonimonas tenax]
MKSICDIFWTPNALKELEQTIEYLEGNFPEKEIKKLAEKIELTIELISKNPNLFPKSENKKIHKAVLLKYNSMYYRVKNESIEILSFFSNRQSPSKKKF